ncbi:MULTISPECIES: PssD/Cps14F family polysaccharide biosynthesis glycosyltransferase [unclassified Lacrimispora]|uniref:PssD/Cps14F family polysaccharide biosynthesis glycosyltransferase n=1 Tax=unclassified Lacrimispora TaxID=2719232 RepID=UPI0037702698
MYFENPFYIFPVVLGLNGLRGILKYSLWEKKWKVLCNILVKAIERRKIVVQNNKLKVCFCSSSGGHFEQLMMLKPLMEDYDSFIVTEKIGYDVKTNGLPVKYVLQINRMDKLFILKFMYNIFLSFCIILKQRPDLIISTGALASVPMMVWTKVFRGKVIYIESFAKIDNPTISGKIAYKFAHQFYVQWESMKKFYPNAVCKGGIY